MHRALDHSIPELPLCCHLFKAKRSKSHCACCAIAPAASVEPGDQFPVVEAALQAALASASDICALLAFCFAMQSFICALSALE
jgi:hypothetical protein